MNDIRKHQNKISIGHLLAIIGRLHATCSDRCLENIGIYRGQAIFLLILSENDGLTHSEIANRLAISPAAATKVIKRLEELNYLRRQSDPTDERISRVFLQEEGLKIINQIKDSFQNIDLILLEEFNPQEQEALLRLLRRVYNNLLDYANSHQ